MNRDRLEPSSTSDFGLVLEKLLQLVANGKWSEVENRNARHLIEEYGVRPGTAVRVLACLKNLQIVHTDKPRDNNPRLIEGSVDSARQLLEKYYKNEIRSLCKRVLGLQNGQTLLREIIEEVLTDTKK